MPPPGEHSLAERTALLLEEGATDRKVWIENRIEELAQISAVAVGGVAVMTNHRHLLLRLDPEVAKCWSDESAGEMRPRPDLHRRACSSRWLLVFDAPANPNTIESVINRRQQKL